MDAHVAIRAAIEEWSKTPMRWGVDDCALAAANIHIAMGLPDLAAAWRGRYRSQRGAMRVLGRPGLAAALASVGGPPIAPSVAPSGSFGYLVTADGPACVIKYGPVWLGRIDYGYTASPSDLVIQAWSAPCRKPSR